MLIARCDFRGLTLKDRFMAKFHYDKSIRIGAAGGIGTPEAAASAFILGADFIMMGSINQCTVEAGTSDLVKDLLQDMNIQDTALIIAISFLAPPQWFKQVFQIISGQA